MLFFVFRKHCVKYKSYMASMTTSLSPHHSINKVDPCTTNRVLISCEKRKKPCSASSFRYSQTEKEKRAGSVLLTGCLPPPPASVGFPPQITMLSAGHGTLFPPGSIWTEVGSTSSQGHVLGMPSWPPLNLNMIAAYTSSTR